MYELLGMHKQVEALREQVANAVARELLIRQALEGAKPQASLPGRLHMLITRLRSRKPRALLAR